MYIIRYAQHGAPRTKGKTKYNVVQLHSVAKVTGVTLSINRFGSYPDDGFWEYEVRGA